jgi:cytochrome c-type biogenesis protein CcmH/NrfG
MRRNALIALCTGFAALALAAPVFAASGAAANADCEKHSKLTASYTTAELQNALATMSATEQEYTNCQQVIQTQLLSQSGTGPADKPTGSGGSGGSFLPTPVIVILVLLALAAATFGAIEVRRRRSG